jgi:hypothetical protein
MRMCSRCGGAYTEPSDAGQGIGYGGHWCQCQTPGQPRQLTTEDVRQIVREELRSERVKAQQ